MVPSSRREGTRIPERTLGTIWADVAMEVVHKSATGTGEILLIIVSFVAEPGCQVREYFGTRIALYFTFLGVYTWQLVIPTLLGILTFIVDFATDGPDAKGTRPLTPVCD